MLSSIMTVSVAADTIVEYISLIIDELYSKYLTVHRLEDTSKQPILCSETLAPGMNQGTYKNYEVFIQLLRIHYFS